MITLHTEHEVDGGILSADPQSNEVDTRARLRCFVIGPIGSRLAATGTDARGQYEDALQVLEEVILPACQAVGLQPVRADGLTRAGEITEQIFRRLRDDDVVIADMTGANPNVMYELGLRHPRNALTLQIGEYGRLPFDINVIRTVQFSRSAYGLVTARNELIELLETGLAGEFDPVTATRVWNEEDSDPLLTQRSNPEIEDQVADPDDSVNAPGFMDLIAEAEENQPRLTAATQAVAERIGELGDAASSATQRMEISDSQGRGMTGRLAVAGQYASQINAIAERLERDVTEYEAAMQAVSAGNHAIIERLEEDPEQLSEASDFGLVLRGLAASAREGLESQQEMVAGMQSAATASRIMRPPTNRVAAALDRFSAASQTMDAWDRRLQALGFEVPPPSWAMMDDAPPAE